MFRRVLFGGAVTPEDLVFAFQRTADDGARTYTDAFDTEGWRHAQAAYHCNPNKDGSRRLLYLHLYCDVTTENTIGSRSVFPVYASLGNIPVEKRRKHAATILIGLIPVLPGTNGSGYSEHVFQECMRVLFQGIDDIHQRGGIPLRLRPEGQLLHFFPVIGLIIGDYPQQQETCGCFVTPSATYFCRMEKTHKKNSVKRSAFGGKRSRSDWEGMTATQREEFGYRQRQVPAWNAKFALGVGEVFRSTPGDVLHGFELSWMKDIMVLTMAAIREQVPLGAGRNDAFEDAMERLGENCRLFPVYNSGLKGTTGVRPPTSTLANFTGTQLVNLFQVFPFCIQGILDQEGPLYKKLQLLFISLEKVARMLLSCRVWTDETIVELQESCELLIARTKAAFGDKFNMERPIAHNLLHFADHIKTHGPPGAFDTAPFESFHVVIKRQLERSALGEMREYSLMQRDAEESLMKLYLRLARAGSNIDDDSAPTGWRCDQFADVFEPASAAREPLDAVDIRTFKGFEDCIGEVLYYEEGKRLWKLRKPNTSKLAQWNAESPCLPTEQFHHLQRDVCSWLDFYCRHVVGECAVSRAAPTSSEVASLTSTMLPNVEAAWFTQATVVRSTDGAELFRVPSRYANTAEISFVSFFDDRLEKAVVGMVEFFVQAALKAGPVHQFAVVRQLVSVESGEVPFLYANAVRFPSNTSNALVCVPVPAIVRKEHVVPNFGDKRGSELPTPTAEEDLFESFQDDPETAINRMEIPEVPPLETDTERARRLEARRQLTAPPAAKEFGKSSRYRPQDYASLFWVKRGLIV